jgi:Spy/CpxP family protein refolding chaperone
MRKTKAMARAALASMTTAALASASLGGTAFAWGHEDEDEGGKVTCNSGSGNMASNTTTQDSFLALIPVNAGVQVPIQGNPILSPNFCG